jgi:hypothetical protein
MATWPPSDILLCCQPAPTPPGRCHPHPCYTAVRPHGPTPALSPQDSRPSRSEVLCAVRPLPHLAHSYPPPPVLVAFHSTEQRRSSPPAITASVVPSRRKPLNPSPLPANTASLVGLGARRRSDCRTRAAFVSLRWSRLLVVYGHRAPLVWIEAPTRVRRTKLERSDAGLLLR